MPAAARHAQARQLAAQPGRQLGGFFHAPPCRFRAHRKRAARPVAHPVGQRLLAGQVAGRLAGQSAGQSAARSGIQPAVLFAGQLGAHSGIQLPVVNIARTAVAVHIAAESAVGIAAAQVAVRMRMEAELTVGNAAAQVPAQTAAQSQFAARNTQGSAIQDEPSLGSTGIFTIFHSCIPVSQIPVKQ